MLFQSGMDPDTLDVHTWGDVFYFWCRGMVQAGADPKRKGDAARRVKEFDRELWDGIERPKEEPRKAYAQAQSALAQLGAMHG